MMGLSAFFDLKPESENKALIEIDKLDKELNQHFQDRFFIHPSLTRLLVSFQANKSRPLYRWYKYKEAFSAALVEFLFNDYQLKRGKILDPFAGSGTALFAASNLGINADGIELLPIGQEIIKTRKLLELEFNQNDFERLTKWIELKPWKIAEKKIDLPEFKITKGAYSPATQYAIERYLSVCEGEKESVSSVLRFALLCILESISYTRKDGQYLRWDYRASRKKTSFNKGEIADFDRAIANKLGEIIQDLNASTNSLEIPVNLNKRGGIELYQDSCLQVMSSFPDAIYEGIMTSPPYCNRYDYTRTYALELALLGVSEKSLASLRQEMLSCTVENRSKDLLAINSSWKLAIDAADSQPLLQSILCFLENQKLEGALNNNGIPRMIRGYFYEMACVIQECHRVLKPGAFLFMVNDNVRYAGVSISVDTILSSIAEKLGFIVDKILVLPGNKGNSSQQMGNHGRVPLRKCVYVWKKE
ncbi:DNA methyltransferase [Oscillatoria sp. FACHB-1406]|uniref:DNA methyltransferase n=1 Tax=Oscillatoria sp. FACHB-1406 TaxID=2692846 RepID=UPI0016869197|nr:DNA methyltransferase [Oscillatoria sp. FACHB-1406]MBD2577048.1 site-specific DNA-methyltransferase [Oscillatoria sp. FACHB-1406]